MSLTKNDEEAIRQIIRDVLADYKSDTTEEEFNWGAFFRDWDDNKINLVNNINLAPEDFVLPVDFKLKDGTVLRKGRQYFTYDEAMALEEELFKPHGWRLPESREFVMLYGAYGIDKDGKDDVKSFHKNLHLELTGWVPDDVIEKYGITLDEGLVIYRTTGGNWWSRNASSATSAYGLGTYLSSEAVNVDAQNSVYRGDGFSVRCVFEGK